MCAVSAAAHGLLLNDVDGELHGTEVMILDLSSKTISILTWILFAALVLLVASMCYMAWYNDALAAQYAKVDVQYADSEDESRAINVE